MLDVVFGVLLVGTILFGILSDFEDRGIAILEIIIIVSGCIYFGWQQDVFVAVISSPINRIQKREGNE